MFGVRFPRNIERTVRLRYDSVEPYRFVVASFSLMNCGVLVERPCSPLF